MITEARRNLSDETALIRAAHDKDVEEIVRLLSKRGIDVNIADDNEGDTALIITAGNGQLEAVRILWQQPGIKLDIKNKKGKAALSAAKNKQGIGRDYNEIVRLISN